MPSKDEPAVHLMRHLNRRLWLARLALAWESLWPVLWPVVGVAGLFLAIALFDVLPHLPGPLHALVLAGFAGALGYAGWRCIKGFSFPDDARARRRIERDSGLEHRPLAVLGDRIAGNPRDPVARALWQLHRRRVLAAITSLRVALPSPGLPARDPYALRAAVLLLLVIAFAAGHTDAPGRLARALVPEIGGDVSGGNLLAQLWLTPPPYTGLPPVFLQYPDPGSAGPARAIVVPAGSSVMALLQGTTSTARLKLGSHTAEFSAIGDGSQKAEDTLATGDSLTVTISGSNFASWPLQVVADAVPSVRFTEPPQGDDNGRLRLTLEASDDFGIAKVWVEVRPVDRPTIEPLTVELATPLSRRPGGTVSPRAGGTTQTISARQDLTAHAWAGLPVTLTPVALDGANQRGAGEPLNTLLPERIFTHPVAKAIVELRRKLGPSTPEVAQAMWSLDQLAAAPEAFGHDTVVFLQLRDARARLRHGRDSARLDQVRDQLWQTALRVEDGDKGIAERNLAEASRALEEALERGASPEELDALMNQLQQAMEHYLEALAQEMQRKGMADMPMDPNAQTISPEELAGMLEQMREMAKLGSRDAAQQMLSELRNMMDSLRTGMQGGGMSPQMRQAQQAIQDLSAMAREQRQLMDQSFRQAQQPPKSGDRAANQQGATQQDELRRRLGDTMRSLGESLGDIPQELGNAEQSMRDAAGRLGQNDPGSAAEAQGQALQGLQQGAQAAMEALSQQMQQGGAGMAGMQNGGGLRRDPFGRRQRNPLADDGSVHIPDESEMHKAHDVLDELRRRAGQPDRPRTERDYLQRLLQTF